MTAVSHPLSLEGLIGEAASPGGERSFDDIRRRADHLSESVPHNLRDLAVHAAFWGITDDVYRIDFINSASPVLIQDLLQTVFDPSGYAVIDSWLEEREKVEQEPSTEYLAFSHLINAAEQADVIAKKQARENQSGANK